MLCRSRAEAGQGPALGSASRGWSSVTLDFPSDFLLSIVTGALVSLESSVTHLSNSEQVQMSHHPLL